MKNSNIFLAYQDGRGNVTLSPRFTTAYQMPTLDTSAGAARLTLLAGSGVSGDTMIANVACDNCLSGNGGAGASSIQANAADTRWISAWKEGASLATSDRSARISKHDETSILTFDLTQAVIDGDANPFLQVAGQGSNTGTGSGNSNGAGSSSGASSTTIGSPNMRIAVAHGIIMALVFVVLYPLGSLLMPVFGRWIAHGAWQIVAFALMWAAFGLGVTAARERSIVSLLPGIHA